MVTAGLLMGRKPELGKAGAGELTTAGPAAAVDRKEGCSGGEDGSLFI